MVGNAEASTRPVPVVLETPTSAPGEVLREAAGSVPVAALTDAEQRTQRRMMKFQNGNSSEHDYI